MRRVFTCILCVIFVLSFAPAVYAETGTETVLFFEDFERYPVGSVIQTSGSPWSSHVKNDSLQSSCKVVKEGDNQVGCFSILTPDKSSGPELCKTLDISGLEDLTITCRAKQSGGASLQINLFTDGAMNVTFAKISSESWVDVEIAIDLSKLTFTTKVAGSVTHKNEPINAFLNPSQFTVRLKQVINSEKFGYWDDVKITSKTALSIEESSEEDWFAWTIPDEAKAKGTAIDASFLLEKPAGKHGFVKIEGDEFVFEDGTEARFWGTNVVFNANYMSCAESEILADRIARSGYNIVRLHMYDTSREPNIFAPGTSRTFDETYLDRFFYFTAALKERGIYVYMDLLVHRKAYAADGIEAVEDVDNKGWQSESHYDAYLRELQKEFAYNILTRLNPYTGLAFKDDPQMAMVGITNESSVTSIVLNNGLYPSTEYYQDILNTKFNTWLKEKYGSNAKLSAAWNNASSLPGLLVGESLADGTVSVRKDINAQSNYSEQRRRDTMEFLTALEQEFYTEMSQYLKEEIGIKCPCTGTALGGSAANNANLYANAKYTDYVSRNNYYGTASSTLYNATHVEGISSARIYGKPYIITEWCCYEPNPFVAESTLLMSTYAQFQDWNMIHFQMWHENTLPSAQAAINTTFVEYQHPVRTALAPATGQNYLRGAVSENKTEYYYPKTYADATNPDNASLKAYQNTGIYAKSGLMYDDIAKSTSASDASVSERIEQKAKDGDAEISEQIYWDLKTGDFRVATEFTQGVAGFRRDAVDLEYVTFDMDNAYYTAIVNSMTNDKIHNSDRLLLSIAARCHNTNREVSEDHSDIVNNGKGPVLVEPVTGKVTLKLSGDYDVYALTSSGERKEKLPITKNADGFTFELKAEHQTLNYEICAFGTCFEPPLPLDKDGIEVVLNGEMLAFDVEPTLLDGRTLVPVRAIFEALGATVHWDDASQTAIAQKDGTEIRITIGEKQMLKNGLIVPLDVGAVLIDGRTLVPVRAIAESFECSVEWLDATQTVKITTK